MLSEAEALQMHQYLNSFEVGGHESVLTPEQIAYEHINAPGTVEGISESVAAGPGEMGPPSVTEQFLFGDGPGVSSGADIKLIYADSRSVRSDGFGGQSNSVPPERPLLNEFSKDFLSQSAKEYPFENELFLQYASRIETAHWPSGEVRDSYFEIALRNFDTFARTASLDVVGEGLAAFQAETAGPKALIPEGLQEAAGLSTLARPFKDLIAGIYESFDNAGDIKGVGDTLDVLDEALILKMEGPKLYNQTLFKQIFNRSYDHRLNPFTPQSTWVSPPQDRPTSDPKSWDKVNPFR